MPDRLAELLRQRALIQEHLAWLDEEIAAAAKTAGEKTTPPPAAPTPVAPAAPAATPAPAVAAPIAAAPSRTPTPVAPARSAKAPVDALMEEYRVSPASVHQDVRKGCLLYFALAFVVLILGVAGLWFIFRR